MQSKGNGRPERCAANLLSITQGEVPYARDKGSKVDLIDKPSSLVIPEVRADIDWVLKNYEPRVNLNDIDMHSILSKEGQFGVDTDIIVK